MSVINFPSKKKPSFDLDSTATLPTEEQITGFLATLDYFRSLSNDDDVELSVDGGELFMKVKSYHDYSDKNGIESAVKMEKMASTMLSDQSMNDNQIGDLVTRENIKLVLALLKQVDFNTLNDDETK